MTTRMIKGDSPSVSTTSISSVCTTNGLNSPEAAALLATTTANSPTPDSAIPDKRAPRMGTPPHRPASVSTAALITRIPAAPTSSICQCRRKNGTSTKAPTDTKKIVRKKSRKVTASAIIR